MSDWLGAGKWFIPLDRMGQKLKLLVSCDVDGQIDKASLNFCPFVAHFTRKTLGVLVERLMQDSDEEKTAFAAGSQFSKILKEKYIVSILSCAL